VSYVEIEQATGTSPVVTSDPTGDGNSEAATVDPSDVNQDHTTLSPYDPTVAVERFYQELALPLSATQEEIKGKYKQLVRLHHPDRFVDLHQKALAEERFKAINEAYRVLSSRAVEGQLAKFMQRELGLVIEPSIIDFGPVERRQQRTATFHVRFEKEVEGVDFVPSEEDSWFRVTKVSHLYGTHHAALEFEVAIDTTGLAAQSYQGWIDIYLDGTMTRVPLSTQVVRRSWQSYQFPRRWLLAGTFILAFLLFTAALAFTNAGSFSEAKGEVTLGATETQYKRGIGANTPLHGVINLAEQPLFFSLLEQGRPTIYSTELNSSALPQRVVAGTEAVALQNHQLVAYLDQRTPQIQIFLYNQATSRTVQVTTDPLPKSQLAWSSDGRYLAYLVGSGTNAYIGLYEPESRRTYRLPGEITAGVSVFAWSPDGTTLLFDLWRDAERRVYRMAVPAGELQQLTQFDSWGGTWSADGNAVIVASATGLYHLDEGGRQLRQLTSVAADRPQWSADGAWVAYLTTPIGRNSQEQHLWLMRPDGSAAQQVAVDVLWHAWSPDGTTLGYVTGNRQSSAALFYLWTTQPDGQATLRAEVTSPYFAWGR
jgi:Tol biopolymer transport system component